MIAHIKWLSSSHPLSFLEVWLAQSFNLFGQVVGGSGDQSLSGGYLGVTLSHSHHKGTPGIRDFEGFLKLCASN